MKKQVSGGNTLLAPRWLLEKAGIKEKMIVADLGCGGAGYFTLVAAEMVGNKGRVYAVDILKSVLQSVMSYAKMAGATNVIPVWSNLEIFNGTKEIESGSLDFGLLINILFQSKKQAAVIKESVRMIKPDGWLLIVDWKSTGAPFGPDVNDRPNKEELKEIARQLGLKLVDDFAAGHYHFGLLFKKAAPRQN